MRYICNVKQQQPNTNTMRTYLLIAASFVAFNCSAQQAPLKMSAPNTTKMSEGVYVKAKQALRLAERQNQEAIKLATKK